MGREKIFKIWLSTVKGIGYKSFVQLMEFFKTAEEVYKAKEIDIFKAIGNRKLVQNIIEAQKLNPFDYIERLQNLKISVYTLDEEEYPKELKNIYDPPPVLYLKGNINLKDNLCIAMVGSRNATFLWETSGTKIGI